MSNKQKTIKAPISFSGVGIHTGVKTTVTIKPAPIGTWFTFIRTDLPERKKIKAVVENVLSTERCTTIGLNDEVKVSTIEHLLASLYSTGIDNVYIEIDGPEVPILDGSAKEIMPLLTTKNIVEQESEQNILVVEDSFFHDQGDEFSRIFITPDTSTSYEVYIDFKSKSVPTQSAKISSLSEFNQEISKCRSFCFFHEIKPLIKNNLLQAKDINSGVVFIEEGITDKEFETIKTFLPEDIKSLYLNGNEKKILNTNLRFDNEPARHKLMDLIGDLALLGGRIQGRIIAYGPGHKMNCAAAKKLSTGFKKNKIRPPKIDITKESLIPFDRLKELLPHRYPFLFVDKVVEISNDHIVGVKNVSLNEWFFEGHFPNEPVFPGVLQIETMAQIGGLLVLHPLDNPQDYNTYLLKIESAKFKKKVVPGDVVVFHLSYVSPFRRGMAHMKGQAYVSDVLVSEAVMLAQIVKK